MTAVAHTARRATDAEVLLEELPALLVSRTRAAELLGVEPTDVDDMVASGG
jgi:hypothetical protein